MAEDNLGPKSILSAAMTPNQPTESWRLLMTPEEQATVDLGAKGGPEGIGGPRPPGMDNHGDQNSPVTIGQVDPGQLVIGWAPGTEPMRGLLDRISVGEGTSDTEARRHPGFNSGYDATYSYQPTPKPLSQMTLNEIGDFQRQMPGSTPVGKYQIRRETLADLEKKLELTGKEMFSPDLQDRMGRELLEKRGWNAYADGRIDPSEFQKRLGTEWDSVAMPDTGLTRHGRTARTSSLQIQDAIQPIVRYK